MGRAKVRLRRIESKSGRQVTFSKRRTGILEKAKDLSVLCDVDVLLLVFSPSGRPTFFHSGRQGIESVLAKLSRLAPGERARRNLGSLQILTKTLKKTMNEADVPELSGPISATYEAVKGLADQVNLLRSQLMETRRRLSCWVNVESIESVEELGQLEESLGNSFYRIFSDLMRANDHLRTTSMPQTNLPANWSNPNFPDEAHDEGLSSDKFAAIG